VSFDFFTGFLMQVTALWHAKNYFATPLMMEAASFFLNTGNITSQYGVVF
jgi:hypothetical protein